MDNGRGLSIGGREMMGANEAGVVLVGDGETTDDAVEEEFAGTVLVHKNDAPRSLVVISNSLVGTIGEGIQLVHVGRGVSGALYQRVLCDCRQGQKGRYFDRNRDGLREQG